MRPDFLSRKNHRHGFEFAPDHALPRLLYKTLLIHLTYCSTASTRLFDNCLLLWGKKLTRGHAKKLKLSKVESDYLCLLGQLESETDSELRENIVKELTRLNPVRIPMQDLTIDQYKQISDWHQSAILELVYLDGFKFTPEKVAKKIGISKAEAELAKERLLHLELLSVSKDGTYQRQSGALQMRAACDRFFDEVLSIADSVRQIKVDLDLIFSSDDEQFVREQSLLLENTSGSYQIKDAVGVCDRTIRHN